MTAYTGLKYKTPGNASPQGRPRVFFCCHPDDFERMFEPITKEILEIQENAAIWYYDPKEGIPEGEEFLADLSQMQLFVIPVTSAFIYQDNPARTYEFAYAVNHHIPVLPLMQESGLEGDFNRICGDLQFLDKAGSQKDATAIPYEEKLKKFLESVLVGDEEAQKIRNAFDAYIFLSYRKKDRRYAQQIMRWIHQNDFCRDIAIWYDEFLTPGENFNNAIEAAMQKSSLFAFVVTPNLLENPNYVLTVEYPEARRTGKTILPIQGLPTNWKKLSASYTDIPPVITEKQLPERLQESVQGLTITHTDPAHEYWMGLAYLSGIDVEVDHERALALIQSAADKRLPAAYLKLVSMYRTGEGVARNYETAIAIQKKYVSVLEERYAKNPDETNLELVVRALWALGDYQKEKEWIKDARQSYQAMHAYVRKFKQNSPKRRYYTDMCTNLLASISYDAGDREAARKFYKRNLNASLKKARNNHTPEGQRKLAGSLYNSGCFCREEKDLQSARKYFQEALEIREKLAEKDPTPAARYEVMETVSNLGEIARQSGDPSVQKEYHQKALDIALQLVQETNAPKYRRAVCICYGKMAYMCQEEGKLSEALDWYQKELNISQKLAEETDLAEDHSLLSSSYENIAAMYRGMGKLKEAYTWYMKALPMSEKLAEETNSMEYRSSLASVYMEIGSLVLNDHKKRKEAKTWLEKCLGMRQALAEEFDTFDIQYALSGVYERLAFVCSSEKDDTGAKEWYQKCLELREKLSGGKDSVSILQDLSRNYMELGDLYLQEGNYSEAKQYYKKAHEIIQELVKKAHRPIDRRDLVYSFLKLGEVDQAEGRFAEAEAKYIRGLNMARKLAQNTEMHTIRECLSYALIKIGSLDSIPESRRLEYMKEYALVNVFVYSQKGLAEYIKTMMAASKIFRVKIKPVMFKGMFASVYNTLLEEEQRSQKNTGKNAGSGHGSD